MAITVITYKLRGGQLTPGIDCSSGLPSNLKPDFYSQTFGAERQVTIIDDAKIELLASTDFQGQKESPNGIDDIEYIKSTYSSASYQGTGLRTTDGDLVYSADETFVSQWIEEDAIGQG
jgi:hypothetical protein